MSALFVTLDPARDTPDRMHQYAGFFHPGIIGLTGDIADIDAVAARYGISWARKSAPESALGYSIAHPDTILLVDADGVLTSEVRGEEGAEALRARVLELLGTPGMTERPHRTSVTGSYRIRFGVRRAQTEMSQRNST